jgi:predicted metal-dependent HD superfamily phosphohydrolase
MTKPEVTNITLVRLTDEDVETVRAALLAYMMGFTRHEHMLKKIRHALETLPEAPELVEPAVWAAEDLLGMA